MGAGELSTQVAFLPFLGLVPILLSPACLLLPLPSSPGKLAPCSDEETEAQRGQSLLGMHGEARPGPAAFWLAGKGMGQDMLGSWLRPGRVWRPGD